MLPLIEDILFLQLINMHVYLSCNNYFGIKLSGHVLIDTQQYNYLSASKAPKKIVK